VQLGNHCAPRAFPGGEPAAAGRCCGRFTLGWRVGPGFPMKKLGRPTELAPRVRMEVRGIAAGAKLNQLPYVTLSKSVTNTSDCRNLTNKVSYE
jgi:hypothetical protein